MSTSIFESVPGWSFTEDDEKAKIKLGELRIQAAKQLPPDHKSNLIVLLFDEIRKTKLYSALKTLPKGVIHHLHFDCCEDQQFYAQYVIKDPIVYLGKKLDCFWLGTEQQAQKNSWVTMQKAREKFQSEEAFIKHVSNLTMLNRKELSENFTSTQEQCWDKFQSKISNFFPILGAVHLFKKYTIHILRKFIKNGYDRIQFRSLLTRLKQYNEKGQVVKEYDQTKFLQVFDQAYEVVKKEYPPLTVGFIFFGLKMLPPHQNEQILSKVLEKNWQKTVGIDFVQQEDSYGSQAPYDEIANKVLQKFPNQNIKKVYHGGETKNHLNRNLQVLINSGSARIGHGINILQHPDLIEICRKKQICFEKNPVSNIILSYVRDPRVATGPLLLGLGVPITINPDDPGKFGLEDNTMDYFVTFISSNWSLKHLKLIGLHSINHAICSEQLKQDLHKCFNKRWDEWVKNFISK